MQFTEKGYVKQLMLYISNEDYEQAYPLAKEFLKKFPDAMFSHYLLATAAFWRGEHEEAADHGRKAFNLATTREDLVACAIVTSSAYYELKRYDDAYEMLSTVEKIGYDEEIEKLLFVFSLELKDENEAFRHARKLYGMNKQAIKDLMRKFLQ